MDFPASFHSALGLISLMALAWLLGEDRRRNPLPIAITGLVVQLILAFLLLKLSIFQILFLNFSQGVDALNNATQVGTRFVFGFLAGGEQPYLEKSGTSSFILAFQAFPLVLVISALSALLFHWRILQWIVKGFSWVLQRSLGVGGALGLASAANAFVGMVEAPLLIRPYLATMTRSELFAVMVGGMANIAGTVMVLYATLLKNIIPDAMGHILTASLISVPAAITVARLMIPETGPATGGELTVAEGETAHSAMDAITRGTLDGVTLLTNIVAMLVVLVALVSLLNQGMHLLPEWGGTPLTLQRILGWLLAPLAWLTGIPWSETPIAGALLGTKTALNELLAYLDLATLPPESLSPRSRLVMTYALCGFANLGSLGIMIGGMGTMVPERRPEIVALGVRSIVAGTLASCMTGAVAGLFLP